MRIGPQTGVRGSRSLFEGVQRTVFGRISAINPCHAAFHLLGIGIDPGACDIRHDAAISVPVALSDDGIPHMADVRERLP